MPDEHSVDLLNKAYKAFNERRLNEVLELIDADVKWANGMEGGYIYGKDALRDYWTFQWQIINPVVNPTSFSETPEGRIDAKVHQVVYDLSGNKLSDGFVIHSYLVHKNQVISMEIKD